MTNGHLHAFVRFIRQVAGADGCGVPDVQLLRRFVERRDEDAFAALVQRHAPMVLGVCGRLLRDANDAEDALQATFLVLVRKATSISRPNLLANWLYGVARRTALAAKTRAAKRHMKEKEIVDTRTIDASLAPVWADLRPVLDEEVSRLPARYRVPFVLCYLEGRTNEEAAQLIGCPKGTVLSRLSWARERLRTRLTRRGLAPSAAVLAAVLSSDVVRAVVPPALVRTSVEVAQAYSAGVAPAASVGVVSLANGVLHHMFWKKTLYVAAFLVIVGLIGGAGVLAWQPGDNLGDGPKALVAAKAPAQNPRNAAENRLGGQKTEVEGKEAQQPPPEPDQKNKADAKDGLKEVDVFQPLVREVTDYEDYAGRTEPVSTVEVRSRVTGYLDKVNAKEGTKVKKGDVLFEIDPRTYQAELDRSAANVAQNADRFRRAEAAYQRGKALQKSNAISTEDLDKFAGDRAEAEAGVRVAEASHESARLNLSFTKLTAPVSGTIGRRFLDTGSLVKANDAVLATIVTQDPMVVHFDIDERAALRLRRALGAGKPNAREWSSLPVAMALADEKGFPHPGKVESADSRVNPDTGTLRVRAVFPNADGLMVPGLFCRVRLTVSEPYQVLVVPALAVVTRQAPSKPYVLVVNAENKAQVREVTLRPGNINDPREVKDGIKAGEWVVVDGGVVHFRKDGTDFLRTDVIRPGMTVNPRRVPMPAQKSADVP